MAFKELTNAAGVHWVNTDQIAWVFAIKSGGSAIQFATVSDSRTLTLNVNETPEQILGAGKVNTFQ